MTILLWTEWPNSPALATLGPDGIDVTLRVSTETKLLSKLRDFPSDVDVMVICRSSPRWAFRCPERVRVVPLGCDVRPALGQIITDGRCKVDHGWFWTPDIHLLSQLMREPKAWSTEFTDRDGKDGSHSNHSIEP